MSNLSTQGASPINTLNNAPHFGLLPYLCRWVIAVCALLFSGVMSYAPLATAQINPTQNTPTQNTPTQNKLAQNIANSEYEDYSLQVSAKNGFTTAPLPKHWENQDRILTITAPFIDLHTFAGRGYPVFHALEQNDTVYLIKRRNDWFKIETQDGKQGWIPRSSMSLMQTTNATFLNITPSHWREHQKNAFEVGLMAGSFDGAIAYTPYLGYHFTPNIQVEFNYTQAFGGFSNLKTASLSLIHKPFPDWRITPFFKLSSGFIKTDPSTIIVQSVDRQDSLFSVGGGLFFYPSNRLVLRAEYNKHTILTTREINEEVEEWKAGFGVLF